MVLSPAPLKNDGVSNSWDDDISNWMESHEIPWFQTTKQYNSPSDWINLDNMDNVSWGDLQSPRFPKIYGCTELRWSSKGQQANCIGGVNQL